VVGNGAIDVVFATGWVSHLDYLWTEPSFACFLVRIASFARLILFDTRGTGLSDGRGDAATAAQRVSDIRTVMDAAGSHRAALVGVSDGGSIATLFAATHPERTCALVTIGSSAKGRSAPDYPWARTCEQHEQFQEDPAEGAARWKGTDAGSHERR
jgi:pimeloyl-ACP methyl ester carboxylesterase